MTNEEIVRLIIMLDKKINVMQEELNILKTSRYELKKGIVADDVEIEEYQLKEKILKKTLTKNKKNANINIWKCSVFDLKRCKWKHRERKPYAFFVGG